jgi:ATP-dependent DNA ligase
VRLITRGGYNWTSRYSWIVESALKNRHKQFVIDGEAVILGVDGIADFNALHSRQHDEEVQLCAFDLLVEGGDDLPQAAAASPQGQPRAPARGRLRQPVRARRERITSRV